MPEADGDQAASAPVVLSLRHVAIGLITCPPEIGVGQVRRDEPSAGQDRPVEIGAGQLGVGEVGAGYVEPGRQPAEHGERGPHVGGGPGRSGTPWD